MTTKIQKDNTAEPVLEKAEPLFAAPQKNKVKIPYAEKEGRLVHVSTVERGLKCNAVCPVCKTPVVARKGAKIRHHFAHYTATDCNPETVLHFIAKHLLYQKLQKALDQNQPMRITWKCKACSNMHSLGLLENVTKILQENNIAGLRPDISLMDDQNNPTAFIEIVVTHRPDKEVVEYCTRHHIPLLIFHINSAESLEALELYDQIYPAVVLFCTRENCPSCHAPLFEKHLFILNVSCWRCGAPMQLAAMQVNHKLYGITHFSEEDKQIAREKGVIFREYFNKKSRQREVAVACRNCGIVTGNQFIAFQKRLLPKHAGIYRGKICLKCRYHDDLNSKIPSETQNY